MNSCLKWCIQILQIYILVVESRFSGKNVAIPWLFVVPCENIICSPLPIHFSFFSVSDVLSEIHIAWWQHCPFYNLLKIDCLLLSCSNSKYIIYSQNKLYLVVVGQDKYICLGCTCRCHECWLGDIYLILKREILKMT